MPNEKNCCFCEEYTEETALENELIELGLDKMPFNYCLEERPSMIFSEDEFLVFTLTFDCYCYKDFNILKDKKIYVYVKADNYYFGERITYGKIFYEINQQVSIALKDIGGINELLCSHKFIEQLTQNTAIEYSIDCGS